MKPYTTRPGSLASQVIEFFERNPEEELTKWDVVIKFDASPESVATLLRPAVRAGRLSYSSGLYRAPCQTPPTVVAFTK